MTINNTVGIRNLVDQDFIDSSARLKVEIAAIKAVDFVESGGAGFLPDGKVKILFEPHIFSRRTKHIFDKDYPNISYKTWRPGRYGKVSEQWPKLEHAIAALASRGMGPAAAYESCSWGRFQVMGFNYALLEYGSAAEMVASFAEDETNHLLGFEAYIEGAMLLDELQSKNWAAFARGYNGPLYSKNKYDLKLADAYARFSK